jgi:hypothetical protein
LTLKARVSITLNLQEVEFALACKEFIAERYPAVAKQVLVENGLLAIPEAPSSKQIFLEFGLARLLRVMGLAIENNAIAPDLVPALHGDLEAFGHKVKVALLTLSRRDVLH